MPRLGLLLAALTPSRAWWERHAQDSSVLTLSVPAGDSFVRATQKLAEDCDLQENEAAIVDAFRGRYRFTLGDSDVAPYRMDLLVTSEHCHRQDISMSTASGWRHNFGALYFDGDDDVDALAALECARISAPGAAAAPGAEMRAHSNAASASTSSSPSKYKAPKLCLHPEAVLMEMSWRWQCSDVTNKSILYGATSLSPRVNRYRPRNASTMAASFSCRSQSSASFCVARTNESPAGTLRVRTELSWAWRSHQALMGVRAASSSPRRGMAAEPRRRAWLPF